MIILLVVICGILLALWLARPAGDLPLYLVAVPKSGEDCEAVLRVGLRRGCRVICLNTQGDPEITRICNILQRTHPGLSLTEGRLDLGGKQQPAPGAERHRGACGLSQ